MDDEDERQSSDVRQTGILWNALQPRNTPLPGLDLKSHASSLSASIVESYHFSMIFSLVDGFKEEAIENAEPALANNLRNLRDHDVGIFSNTTEFIGSGAAFSARRTLFPDSRDVVFKTRVTDPNEDRHTSSMQKLEAILLELRVLTHPPLRHHNNIVQLIQVGWQGDTLDRSLKWPVLIVDYADRGTLAEFFENEAAVDFNTKHSLSGDIAQGLQALHECQIVHGDLKLTNVLVYTNVEGAYTAKLSDFGGALLDSPDLLLHPPGTPPWTAPEYYQKRSRQELLQSDVYALGLLIWRVMLDGANPFADRTLFNLPSGDDRTLVVIEKYKQSDEFLNIARSSILCYGKDLDCNLILTIFENSLRITPEERKLSVIVSCLRSPLPGQDILITERGSPVDSSSLDEKASSREQVEDEETELRLSMAGMDFNGVTRALSERVLKAFEHTAEYDVNPTWRSDAEFLLARIHLGSDDFGLKNNVEKGLHYLTLSAEHRSREDQGLLLRMYRAFGREVPARIRPLLGSWLLAAGATGSMTAFEDMERFGYIKELEEASKQLKTRYCGFGEEIFEFEEEAAVSLLESFDTLGKGYINRELEQADIRGSDLRGYLLRLSAAYGCTDGINYLVDVLKTDVNGKNDNGDTALLFAARSGHFKAVSALIRVGADPTITDRGNDTPLHWLCSFDDSDVDAVAEELVRHGADVNSQASTFPEDGRLEYSETEFVAGTPLHRAICRNKIGAVRKLLSLGADIHSPTLDDKDDTPIALAALLHYPKILEICMNFGNGSPRDKLVTPTGRSLLISAMRGGSVNKITIGRLIRHGDQVKNRAIQTMFILSNAGASQHFSDLPGEPGCTAMLYAAQCQPRILEFLAKNGATCDLDRPSKRYEIDEEDEEDNMKRPPLFEAILNGKVANAFKLLELGANAQARENHESLLTALYQCAAAAFEEVAFAEELCNRGLGVDDGPLDHETPFQCAVRNGCYTLAEFLRSRGADVNALSSRGLLWRSTRPESLLCLLARNNGPSSISGMIFLLDKKFPVDFLVEPSLKHTIFHILATLNGDSHDAVTTTRALELCKDYFDPLAEDLNMKSLPHKHGDGSVEASGGNTALHYAVIHANYEVVTFLLTNSADASLHNTFGMTPLDMAALSYPTFDKRFEPRAIPQSPARQLKIAKIRRDEIMRLLEQHTPMGVNQAILDKFSLENLEGSEDFDILMMRNLRATQTLFLATELFQ